MHSMQCAATFCVLAVWVWRRPAFLDWRSGSTLRDSSAQTHSGDASTAYSMCASTAPRGDGKTLDTDAINRAIDAAAAAGGGMVTFPAGTYLSFSIHLKSQVHASI